MALILIGYTFVHYTTLPGLGVTTPVGWLGACQEPTSINFLRPRNTNQEVSEYLATFPHFRPSRNV